MSRKILVIGFILSILTVGLVFAADTYKIDPVHSNMGFSVRHLGITNVKGRFDDVSGTINYDDKDITKSSVTVTIKASSINTDNTMRDNDLRSDNFFDVAKYPELTFVSNSIQKTSTKDKYIAKGTFTLHGVSKEISILFTILGTTKDPRGNTRMGIECDPITISRKDYGMTYGSMMVGDDVKISLDVEAIMTKS